jgi:hypothetical protein
MSLPERAAAIAVVVTVGALAAGCGKSDLVRHDSGHRTSQDSAHHHLPAHRSEPAAVAIPLKLTAARASAFAKAVNLLPVDVPGSHITPRSPNLESQKEEASQCAGGEAEAIGGGRSGKIHRGSELSSESISSSVIVLPSSRAAQADLAYADSRAGIACYGKILRKSLAGESTSGLSVGHVIVARLRVSSTRGPTARGIRISAHISGVRSGITISLFVDAIAFAYGPAEIELYSTSFIQPIAPRTEEGLLWVLQARARLSEL